LEVVVGDDLLENANISAVNLVKMDIEGYEIFALQGLSRTLAKNRPIVVFEVTVAPGKNFGFQSESQMRSAFPENYRFLMFDERRDGYTGYYHLAEFKVDFDKRGKLNAVAYPVEKEKVLPRESRDEKPEKLREYRLSRFFRLVP
jgi:hypothetical protein